MMNSRIESVKKAQALFTVSLIAAFAVLATSVILFASIADEVLEQDTMWFDNGILTFIHQHMHSPFGDAFIPIATDIGGVSGVILLTALFVGLLALRKSPRRAFFVLLCVGGASALNFILKGLFMRSRPDLWEWIVHESSYSFPSGHAMASAALGLAIIVALWRTSWRIWGIVTAGIYILFVGYTRLYLGVHYPTDVIGGWLVSAAWVSIVAITMQSQLGKHALSHLFRKYRKV